MKNKKMVISLVLLAMLVFGTGFAVGAVTAEPGSSSDPLITKGYLDTRIKEFKQDTGFKKVSIASGKTITCSDGAQFILVSGKVKANVAVVDMTKGKKISKGKKIAKNHTILATGNAQLKASGATTVYVLGSYK